MLKIYLKFHLNINIMLNNMLDLNIEKGKNTWQNNYRMGN